MIVFIKDAIRDIWYHDGFQMLSLVTKCFALQMSDTGPIDFLRHPSIFLHKLGGSAGFYYQLCVDFSLLVGQ